MDVFAREIGEVFQQFFNADRGGERIEHVADAHPRTGDNRPPAAYIGVDDDARGHVGSMWGRGGGVKVVTAKLFLQLARKLNHLSHLSAVD